MFWFFLKLFSETVLILIENGRDVITNVRYSCNILMKVEFSRQAFAKYSNIKFHENPSSGSRVFTCGQTKKDRHDEATSRFRILAEAPKML